MRPCDCRDQYNVDNCLKEAGVAFNDRSILVQPATVILTVGACTLKIPMNTFKVFAEWYLEDQDYAKEQADAANREIMRRDFEREIYAQCDEEDRKEHNCG